MKGEPLDTYRISTDQKLPIHRNGSVHVMNLVEGQRALLVSTGGRFDPSELHYAETCIIPEAAGAYQSLFAGWGMGPHPSRLRARGIKRACK